MMQIAAGEFKSKCLMLMDKVKETKQEIIITKFGIPVAKLTPIKTSKPKSIFGILKDTMEIKGDIISPIGEEWNANKNII